MHEIFTTHPPKNIGLIGVRKISLKNFARICMIFFFKNICKISVNIIFMVLIGILPMRATNYYETIQDAREISKYM